MLMKLAVAAAVVFLAPFAAAQSSHHYEATDENATDEEEDDAPKAQPAPAAPRRTVPRVFRVTRPGGTRAEPNDEAGPAEDGAPISDGGLSQGGQGMGAERALAKPALGDRMPASGGGNGAPSARGCGAAAGSSCQMSPLTFLPPVARCGGPAAFASICGRNIPFDIKWAETSALQYFFHAPANVVQVHPIKFGSKAGGAVARITTQETSDQAGTREAGRARTVVISAVPGSMEPVNLLDHPGSRCGRTVRGLGAYIAVNFSNAPKNGECALKKDVQYYLNVRSPLDDQPFEYLLRVDY